MCTCATLAMQTSRCMIARTASHPTMKSYWMSSRNCEAAHKANAFVSAVRSMLLYSLQYRMFLELSSLSVLPTPYVLMSMAPQPVLPRAHICHMPRPSQALHYVLYFRILGEALTSPACHACSFTSPIHARFFDAVCRKHAVVVWGTGVARICQGPLYPRKFRGE